MRLVYARASMPSALEIARIDPTIEARQGVTGDVNWGRRIANTALNPSIENTVNKRKMRELFKEHGVPMPTLYSPQDAVMGARFGRKLIGRPDFHTRGRGLWKIESLTDLHKALNGTRRKMAATHFMEFIDAPREYRVHIFKGKSIRISEKLHGQTGDTAHGDYITGKPRHNVKHVRQAAKDAVTAVGLDFGAVDILADDTDCWVLEVNAAPGLGGSMPRLYAETFRRYFEGGWDE